MFVTAAMNVNTVYAVVMFVPDGIDIFLKKHLCLLGNTISALARGCADHVLTLTLYLRRYGHDPYTCKRSGSKVTWFKRQSGWMESFANAVGNYKNKRSSIEFRPY